MACVFLGTVIRFVENLLLTGDFRQVVSAHLKETEPEAVKSRRHRRFQRRQFYAAGVNEVWAQDQHDKWGPKFGLWLHNSIDPFTGYNNWLKVWWTNKNPRLIVSYYLEAVRKDGGTFSQNKHLFCPAQHHLLN